MTASPYPVAMLKPRRAKPFFLHHPWVFSGAVERIEGEPAQGDIVTVADTRGRFIGRGFYNPASQIMVRLFSWNENEQIDEGFWHARLRQAIRLRHDTLRLSQTTNAYRLVYSESDGLPGLIVDRYGDYLVVQHLTAGIAARKDMLLDALLEQLRPHGIMERSDAEELQREGIAPARGLVRGEEPEAFVEIECDGLKFLVDLRGGHKTGFYLDQRENRLAIAGLLRGRRVLDAYTYTGAFAIAAARRGGAAEVLAIDRSEPALELARRNAALNGCENVSFQCGKVEVLLRQLKREGASFGAIILDPPKFARTRSGVSKALRAYRDVNLLAMQLLDPEGILITCCCSGRVTEDAFIMMLNDAAVEAGKKLQIIDRRGQSGDHPIIASCPETSYLKCIIGRIQ